MAVGSDPTTMTSMRWEDLAVKVVEEVVAVGSESNGYDLK